MLWIRTASAAVSSFQPPLVSPNKHNGRGDVWPGLTLEAPSHGPPPRESCPMATPFQCLHQGDCLLFHQTNVFDEGRLAIVRMATNNKHHGNFLCIVVLQDVSVHIELKSVVPKRAVRNILETTKHVPPKLWHFD